VLHTLATEQSITDFTQELFVSKGLASKNDRIKILGRGELSAKVNVSAHAFSATAKEAIEKVGGTTATL
jgi:large subunit ribosomal protein L15